jgi:hypothetical protein
MSSYYGIVFPEFWTGDTGRAIQASGGKDAQLLALYEMSCRHATMIGLYPLPLRDIRHETGLGMKGLVRAVTVLAHLGFSEYDARTEHVWVREMAKFRLSLQKRSPLDPDDKRVTGVQNLYDRLVENPFLEPFFDRYAKEVRLKRRRACGLLITPLQDVAPSKGLIRGLEGACKPDNRSTGISTQQGSGSRNQGTDNSKNKPPHKSRRDSLPVEKSHESPESPTPVAVSPALRDRENGDRSGSHDHGRGMESAGEGARGATGVCEPHDADVGRSPDASREGGGTPVWVAPGDGAVASASSRQGSVAGSAVAAAAPAQPASMDVRARSDSGTPTIGALRLVVQNLNAAGRRS